MTSRRTTFTGAGGAELAGLLELPSGPVVGAAVFAHCFTCGKDSLAAARISRALADRGVAVLRFDFTGLGGSGGDFANTGFSSNVEDLVLAAAHLGESVAPATLLVGHSLGGAAVLAAAGEAPGGRRGRDDRRARRPGARRRAAGWRSRPRGPGGRGRGRSRRAPVHGACGTARRPRAGALPDSGCERCAGRCSCCTRPSTTSSTSTTPASSSRRRGTPSRSSSSTGPTTCSRAAPMPSSWPTSSRHGPPGTSRHRRRAPRRGPRARSW